MATTAFSVSGSVLSLLKSTCRSNKPRSRRCLPIFTPDSDWNILSGQMITDIATKVPTTRNELLGCGIPENVRKQYGERLVASINAFVEAERLGRCTENRPKKKPRAMDVPSTIQIPVVPKSPVGLWDSPKSESLSLGNERIGAKRKSDQAALPEKHADALMTRLKALVTMWAEEVSAGDAVMSEDIYFISVALLLGFLLRFFSLVTFVADGG